MAWHCIGLDYILVLFVLPQVLARVDGPLPGNFL
jgi:hypothetical protein